MNNITGITSYAELDIILFGYTHLNETENSEIFLHVQQFKYLKFQFSKGQLYEIFDA